MSAEEIDDYIAGVSEPQRGTLEALRRTILDIVPDAEQCISYRMPAFRVEGQVIAGLAAFKNHVAYLPHSGSVLPELAGQLAQFTMTTGSLHLPVDYHPSRELIEQLIDVRIRQLQSRGKLVSAIDGHSEAIGQ